MSKEKCFNGPDCKYYKENRCHYSHESEPEIGGMSINFLKNLAAESMTGKGKELDYFNYSCDRGAQDNYLILSLYLAAKKNPV